MTSSRIRDQFRADCCILNPFRFNSPPQNIRDEQKNPDKPQNAVKSLALFDNFRLYKDSIFSYIRSCRQFIFIALPVSSSFSFFIDVYSSLCGINFFVDKGEQHIQHKRHKRVVQLMRGVFGFWGILSISILARAPKNMQ